MEPELEGLAVTVLLNERWQEGMGSSLHRGVASVSGLRPEPSGVVLMVCDQLRLNREHLRALLTCQSEGDSWITASFYGGRAGVPAVFSRRLLPALLAVRGDRGARDLIAGYPEQTKLVSWPDGALDLDLPEDLKRGRVE